MNKILIIDDEIDITESISAILSDEGFECTKALNPNDAINFIENNIYDLIILDVWLNDANYDGIKLLKLIIFSLSKVFAAKGIFINFMPKDSAFFMSSSELA